MKKRILSIVLCLILAVGLLPATALAAEINTVKITITQPYMDEKPDFAPKVPAGTCLVTDYPADGYIGGVRWTDTTEGVTLGPEDRFIYGHTYTLRIALGAISPNTFRTAGGDVNVKFILNSAQEEEAKTLTAAGYDDPGAYLSILASFVAGQRPKGINYLSRAYVKVDTPVAGRLPNMHASAMEADFSMPAAGCTVSKVEWLVKNKNGVFVNMNPDTAFTEGTEYAVRVTVRTKDNFLFAAQVKDCWFNSADDKGKATPYSSGTYECVFYKTYTAAPSPDIPVKDGSVTIKVPVAGEKPDYNPAFSDGLFSGGYIFDTDTIRNGVEWSSEKGLQNTSEPFEEGVSYTVTIYFQAREGYAFWKEGAFQTAIEVNGDLSGACTEVDLGQKRGTVTYTFPPAQKAKSDDRAVIPEAVLDLAAPTAGAHPDFDLKILKGECILFSESDYPAIQEYLKEMEEMGYKNSVAWFDYESSKIMTEDDVFEEGKTYFFSIALVARDGWRFNEKETVVTLDGFKLEETEVEDGNIEICFISIGGSCVCGPARTPVALAVTAPPAKTEYKPGEAFDPAGMTVTVTYEDQTSASAKTYTVTPQTLSAGDTAVTISYTENDVTVTAQQAVSVKADLTNPFEDVKESDYFYDAVLWAYYSDPQITVGVDATHFGPDSTVTRGQTVTFLWRAMGCPEPESKTNPFVDVRESDYYFKPVLWAVEKGITVGTDAAHFTPTQTCSTAHILTFLYRTLGIGDNGWYEIAEGWAKGAGLLDGLDVAVAPGVDCPRADVVLFLYRVLA